jgi:GNAT superfamily N-acetyltransferase
MTALTLRDARPGEESDIAEVTLAAYAQYAALMGPIWKIYLQNIQETLADPKPAEQIVAERDGKIVGMVLLYPAGKAFDAPGVPDEALAAPEVRLLAVTPAARGSGVGVALMQECLKRARDAGDRSVTLHTNEIMAVAMAMYERMGFVRAPELDFKPAPEIVIKGYRYDLSGTTSA